MVPGVGGSIERVKFSTDEKRNGRARGRETVAVLESRVW